MYRVGEKVGDGALGIVYICQHKITKKYAVMKSGEKDEILYEARVLSTIQGSIHVPRLLWHGKFDTKNAFVCELLDTNLKQKKQQITLEMVNGNIEWFKNFANQSMSALRWIHEKGFVHRDIKPDNIMLKQDGKTLCLIDYGFAKRYRNVIDGLHIPSSNITSIIGSLSFCSYNIHKQQLPSRRDDLISMLLCLFYILHDKLPWMGLKLKSETLHDTLFSLKTNWNSPLTSLLKIPYKETVNDVLLPKYKQCLEIGYYDTLDYSLY